MKRSISIFFLSFVGLFVFSALTLYVFIPCGIYINKAIDNNPAIGVIIIFGVVALANTIFDRIIK